MGSRDGDRMRFDDFEVDPAEGVLRRGGAVIKIPPQPYKALTFLIDRAGALVTRDELSHAIWGRRTVVDFEHGLNTCLRQIRVALGEDARQPRLIETVPRRGYRFKARVSRQQPANERPTEACCARNPATYVLCARAWSAWDMAVGWNAWAALRLFEQAAALDPDFAQAHAGVAAAYLLLSVTGDVGSRVAAGHAQRAVARALSLSDVCVEAHTAAAMYKWHCQYDWEGAEQSCVRAVELDSDNAAAREFYGLLLAIEGRFTEASEQLDMAQRLDPFAWRVLAKRVWLLYGARQYDEALCTARMALERDPNSAVSWRNLGFSLEANGDLDGAIAAYLKAEKLGAGHLGRAYALAGRTVEAEIMLAALEKRYQEVGVAQVDIAMVHTGLGEIDRAIDWLRIAFQDHAWLGTLKLAAFWDRLRPSPRFSQLLRDVGLADLGEGEYGQCRS
jgi:DNA-binding winged helix-turn-helix (wHTH) protein/tetratricopeptide (TPR) repeat protein